MLQAFKRKVRLRAYFKGFSRALAMVEDLAEKKGKERGIEVLVIPRSTVRALYAGEKERFIQRMDD
jgi:hypothetical protein